ncbi:LPD7 domain-containing protein [Sphingomonas sp. R86520]|uniref:LPD7 domain-containing protein n=1 Tax=Sphingomonas sp. R86520 TaxID=3093859 RepID=UPI0036D21564
MSTENTVSRGGRDVEATAELPSTFQMPPELASRYQVRVIEPSDGSERRVGMFLPRDRDIPSIEIGGNGDRLVARNQDPETIAALVKIAMYNGWEGIDVEGSPEFRQAVWAAGSREGLTVRGYNPEFGEQARMEEQRRSGAARDDHGAPDAQVPATERAAPAPTPEQVGPKPAFEVGTTVAASSVDDDRAASTQDRVPAGDGVKLADGDHRLLLGLSNLMKDRQTLAQAVHEGMAPTEREDQNRRLDLNREVLDNALEWALESPTLVSAFSKSGYKPEDLRQMAREGSWDSEVADAIDRVRSGRDRHSVARGGSGVTADDELVAGRKDRKVAESTLVPERELASEPQIVREERQHDAAAERQHEREELAELFLHGAAERIMAEPRLANALEAQATMERHLGQTFDDDAIRVTTATFESRQLISDVLRRGLDVSVREPTPVRQIEPSQGTLDLER